jgi:hypothetical protein
MAPIVGSAQVDVSADACQGSWVVGAVILQETPQNSNWLSITTEDANQLTVNSSVFEGQQPVQVNASWKSAGAGNAPSIPLSCEVYFGSYGTLKSTYSSTDTVAISCPSAGYQVCLMN